MKIVREYPPNIKEIKKFATLKRGVVFTYGDILYSPDTGDISDDLMVHEETHSKQQTNPNEWWERYFTDIEFRVDQEVEAYYNQYMFFKSKVKNQDLQRDLLFKLASDLSGPIYGGIISFAEARLKIKNGK